MIDNSPATTYSNGRKHRIEEKIIYNENDQ